MHQVLQRRVWTSGIQLILMRISKITKLSSDPPNLLLNPWLEPITVTATGHISLISGKISEQNSDQTVRKTEQKTANDIKIMVQRKSLSQPFVDHEYVRARALKTH